jgi:hypothetical protein
MKTSRNLLAVTVSIAFILTSIRAEDLAEQEQHRDVLDIGRRKAPFYSSQRLTTEDRAITRAIIVIHGSGRNAADYFDSIRQTIPSGAGSARDWQGQTLVIAPHFQEKDDARKGELWWDGDWNRGGTEKGVSSYEVVDALVARLRGGTFPNLKWIIITGHSAGGQFVQRYAAFTDIDLGTAPNAHCVKFVPANPSSYVYLNPYRFSNAQNDWVIPRGKRSKGYNDYKYGLNGLDDYAEERGATWARNHLPRRWVEVLAGTTDVEADDSFDDSREAMWQGTSRYERAQLFDAFMDRFYTPNRFDVTPVPGVGHDHRTLYAMPVAQRALYFPD